MISPTPSAAPETSANGDIQLTPHEAELSPGTVAVESGNSFAVSVRPVGAISQRDSAELAKLPSKVWSEVRWLLKAIALLNEEKNKSAAARALVAGNHGRRGFSAATLLRKRDLYNAAGGDWRVLVNKAKAGPAYWNSAKPVGLPKETQEFYRELCERNQRCDAPAWRQFIRIWETGVDDSVNPPRQLKQFPGFAQWPKAAPYSRVPDGFGERNMRRYAPTKFEKKLMRQGRSATAAFRPLVYGTRKNLWVGSHYVFDDFWHDHFVNILDTRQTGRPLEFHGLDLFSACKFAWGMRVRTRNEITGKMDGLKEESMRFLLAMAFAEHGYSPRGTTLVVEHGTAAVRDDLEQLLSDMSGGLITVSRSGMEGEAAFEGQYAGLSKGNFRFKAHLESLGNLIHNEMAALPAQTGRNVESRPEGLHAMLDRNDALLDAMVGLAQEHPERARMLTFELLEFRQFQLVAMDIYRRINDRTKHKLEGWGNLVVHDPHTQLMRRMSPSEVWHQGKRDLVKLPPAAIAMLLGPDLGVEKTVKASMITIDDKELDPDPLRFEALQLVDGEKYLTVLNPFAPDRLYAFNAAGGLVGVCPRLQSVCRLETQTLGQACGHALKIEAALIAAPAKRGATITRKRIADAQHNAAVITTTSQLEQEQKAAQAAEAREVFADISD